FIEQHLPEVQAACNGKQYGSFKHGIPRKGNIHFRQIGVIGAESSLARKGSLLIRKEVKGDREIFAGINFKNILRDQVVEEDLIAGKVLEGCHQQFVARIRNHQFSFNGLIGRGCSEIEGQGVENRYRPIEWGKDKLSP